MSLQAHVTIQPTHPTSQISQFLSIEFTDVTFHNQKSKPPSRYLVLGPSSERYSTHVYTSTTELEAEESVHIPVFVRAVTSGAFASCVFFLFQLQSESRHFTHQIQQ